jgi:hypothetical protein
VLVIRRPPLPPGERVDSVEAALAWLAAGDGNTAISPSEAAARGGGRRRTGGCR